MITLRSIPGTSTSFRVDKEAGIIYGCALICEGPVKWDRGFVDHETLQSVLKCAQAFGEGGLPIRFDPETLDHGSGGMAGGLRNLRIEGTALIGDLHVMKTYANRDHLFELAETQPKTVGLSVEMIAPMKEIGGKQYARCEEIMAAAVVITPAATGGLYSASTFRDGVSHTFNEAKTHPFSIRSKTPAAFSMR